MSNELQKTPQRTLSKSQENIPKKNGFFGRISPRRLLPKSRSLNSSPERALKYSPKRKHSPLVQLMESSLETEKSILIDVANDNNQRSISSQEYTKKLYNSPPMTPRDTPPLSLGSVSSTSPRNTPPLSPSSVSSTSPREESEEESEKWYLACEYCKNPMTMKQLEPTKKIYFLAIKCTCKKYKYFCSRLCHRTHWIELATSERRCEMFYFKNIPSSVKVKGKVVYLNILDEPLTWRDVEYIHVLDDYLENI